MKDQATAKYQPDESRFFSFEEGQFLREHISPEINYIAYEFLGSFESSKRDKVKSVLHEYAKWKQKREREEDPKRLHPTNPPEVDGLSSLDQDFCKDHNFQWIKQHSEADNADVYIESIKVSGETVDIIKKLRRALKDHQERINMIRIKDGLSTVLSSEGTMRGGLYKILSELEGGYTSIEAANYAKEACQKLNEIATLRKKIEQSLPGTGE